MPRQRSPDSIKGEEMYINSNGQIELVEIAKQLNVSPGTVRSWKNRYKWDYKLSCNSNATLQKDNNKRNVAKKKKAKKPKHIEVAEEAEIENAELNERQRLFCLYYIKSFNQTMAAIKAGYEPSRAHVTGSELVRNSKVAAEIRRLKGTMTNELFIDAMDVLNKYIKIAFADITDFVEFGKKEVVERDDEGKPLTDSNGEIVTYAINYVDFNNSDMVDGTILREVKQGKDGISVKLEGRMKALEKLELYFDLLPDKFKRRIEEEKIQLQKEKLNSDQKDKTMKVIIVDDIEGEENEN